MRFGDFRRNVAIIEDCWAVNKDDGKGKMARARWDDGKGKVRLLSMEAT